jgi:hypothetical protein
MRSRKGKLERAIIKPEKEILDRALNVVTEWSGLKPMDILGRRRFQQIVDARHFWWMLCLRTGEFTLSRLGELVGRDHGSVIHARGRHENMLEVGQQISADLARANYRKKYNNGTVRYSESWEHLVTEYSKAKLLDTEKGRTHDEEHTHSLV